MIEELRAELDYDPQTGQLMWKRTGKGRRLDRLILAKDKDGYIQFCFKRRWIKAHRVIWAIIYGYWPDEIDHWNRDPSDNRLSNLRAVTHAKNAQNRKALGAYFHGKSWRAEITIDGRKRRLGAFSTQQAASAAYWAARAETPA